MRRPLRLIIASVCGTLLSLNGAPPFASAQSRVSTASRAPVAPSTRVENRVTVHAHDAGAFARAPQWTLDPKPLLVAGGANGDPEFDLTYAYTAELLSDGRMATFASIGAKLLVFTSDGRSARTIGRMGKGPGEFMAPSGVARLGADTLLILDGANNRLNWILADKGVVREQSRGTQERSPVERAVGALSGGRVVLSAGGLIQRGEPGKVVRPDAAVKMMSPAGTVVKIAALQDLELATIETRYRGQASTQTIPLRFTRHAHVVVWDSLIATAEGNGYNVDVRNASGRILSRIVVAVPRRPVTRAMREAAIEQALARFRTLQRERMVDPAESERIERATPVADSLPPYSSMSVTAGGTLWIVDAIAPTDTSWSATAFRRDGAIVGRLRARGNAMPITFDNDRVVLRTVDADGVVAFVVRRIVR